MELVSAGSLGLPDPVETGVTFQENALLKARFVAGLTGLPAIADDSGLIVDVMGNAPGILSARWAGKHGDDKANNALAARADRRHSGCQAYRAFPLRGRAGGAANRSRRRRRWSLCDRSGIVETGEMPGVLLHELMASMASATTRCSCPTISRRVRRSRREAHVRADGTGRKERHLPSRQGVARPAAIRGHSAEVGLKRVAAVSIRRCC